MSYNVNPCKACHLKLKKDGWRPSVNAINDCCSETLGAFMGNASINSYRNSPDAQNCTLCVRNAIYDEGRTPCDLRLTMSPTWIQAPHFFPQLLAQYNDPFKAKQQCIVDCAQSKYPNECVINCKTDFSAIIEGYSETKSTMDSIAGI